MIELDDIIATVFCVFVATVFSVLAIIGMIILKDNDQKTKNDREVKR